MRWASLKEVYAVVASGEGLALPEITALLYPSITLESDFRLANRDTSNRLQKLKRAGLIYGEVYAHNRMRWFIKGASE